MAWSRRGCQYKLAQNHLFSFIPWPLLPWAWPLLILSPKLNLRFRSFTLASSCANTTHLCLVATDCLFPCEPVAIARLHTISIHMPCPVTAGAHNKVGESCSSFYMLANLGVSNISSGASAHISHTISVTSHDPLYVIPITNVILMAPFSPYLLCSNLSWSMQKLRKVGMHWWDRGKESGL